MSKLQVLVETLSSEQKTALREVGVTKQRLSDYKAGRRAPSLPHAKAIALVTGTDFSEIADELADMEASPEQLSFFRRAVERTSAVMALGGVAIMLGLVSAPSPAEARQTTLSPAQATDRLYIMSTLRRWLRRTLTALTRSTGRPALTMASR